MVDYILCLFFFFFFKQKTAYEITTGDWSSDVCSSDLASGVASLPCRIRGFDSARSLGAKPVSAFARSEERRVGKECRVLCRSRRAPYDAKKIARRVLDERGWRSNGLLGVRLTNQ